MRHIRLPGAQDVERLTTVVPHESTGGVISFVEQSMKPRALIPGHVHERTDVWIHVLVGTVGVRVGDDESVGGPGDYLLKPRGIPHAMWNPGDDRNRLIEILTPGEGDAFFRDIVQLAPDASRAELEAISARHGIRWFDDWTADLLSRHGLRAQTSNSHSTLHRENRFQEE